MAIPFTPDDVASGFNLTKLNSNFDKINIALQDALSRSGTGPNQMNADIDLNSNDLLNVNDITAERLILNGEIVQGNGGITDALKISNALSELVTNGLEDDARNNLSLILRVNSRTVLKALDTSKDTSVVLREAGREGIFKWTTGDFSTKIAADPQEGVYIKANAISSNAGAWVRDESNRSALDIRWFGAVADSTGVGIGTDSSIAIQAAINLAIVIGYDIEIVGRYRSISTITYNRTTLNSNFGRIPSIRGIGGAGMSGIFFDSGLSIGLDIQGSISAGVFGGFFRIENLTLWSTGKTGSGLKIKDAAFIEVSRVRCRGWDSGFLLQNVISSRFAPIYSDGNIVGVLAENGPSAIPCNALTFENCWISGNDRVGYDLTNVATYVVSGGSCEGNGIVTFGTSPNTSGGLRAVNCGQGGHVGIVIQGVYFEHNAGIADVLIFNDAILSSTSKMCSHIVQGNTFNRVHATEFTTNNVRVSSAEVAQKIALSGNGHGNLGTSGYVEDVSRKYVAITDTNNTITVEDDGSNMYTNTVAIPDFSNTYVRGSFLEAEACGYVASDGTLQAGAKNTSSVAKIATGRYQITLRRPWAGRKACFVIADNRRIPYTFTIDNNSVTVELQDGTTPTDAAFSFVVFKPFY